jgi:crossover junction endodeoxyribonuclease RuvC
MAIEEVFYGKNVKSALLLGHARGASMVCAANNSMPVFEYSARKVKQSITGNGAAHKSQVQYMISKEFNINNDNFPLDASDALAIALCHLNQLKINEL